MKKIICALSIIAILFSLCACGSKETSTENLNKNSTTVSDSSKETKTKKTNKTMKALSHDEFKSLMLEQGLEVYLENKSDRGGITLSKDANEATYYNFLTSEDAKKYYISAEEQANEEVQSESAPYFLKEAEIGKNYEFRIYVNEYNNYEFIAYVDSTFIDVAAGKTEGPQLVKALGF